MICIIAGALSAASLMVAGWSAGAWSGPPSEAESAEAAASAVCTADESEFEFRIDGPDAVVVGLEIVFRNAKSELTVALESKILLPQTANRITVLTPREFADSLDHCEAALVGAEVLNFPPPDASVPVILRCIDELSQASHALSTGDALLIDAADSACEELDWFFRWGPGEHGHALAGYLGETLRNVRRATSDGPLMHEQHPEMEAEVEELSERISGTVWLLGSLLRSD